MGDGITIAHKKPKRTCQTIQLMDNFSLTVSKVLTETKLRERKARGVVTLKTFTA